MQQTNAFGIHKIRMGFLLTVSVFFMRAYLKNMGVSESASRIGAVALGFSGFMNFMVGFPNVTSAVVYVPLMLLGIEKVIKERKPEIGRAHV